MLQFINHIELNSAILSLIFVFIHVSISYMHKANENFVMQNMYDLKSIFIKKKNYYHCTYRDTSISNLQTHKSLSCKKTHFQIIFMQQH